MSRLAEKAKPTILVVEDELLLAADIEEAIRRCGHTCLGPAATLSEALALIRGHQIHAAILDVQLRHAEKAYPALELLTARGIPFALLTGYSAAHIDRRYANCRILHKPVLGEEIELLVQSLLASPEPRSAPSMFPEITTIAAPQRS